MFIMDLKSDRVTPLILKFYEFSQSILRTSKIFLLKFNFKYGYQGQLSLRDFFIIIKFSF